jgi:hypothetical protein
MKEHFELRIATRILSLIVTALLVFGTKSAAQASSVVVGHLGLSAIECDCTFDGRNPTNRIFRFRSDLIVMGVEDGGPSDGILQPGDEIVDIDGIRLRTREGGRRFANIRPGQRVTLGVRRNFRTIRVALTAAAIRVDDESGLGQYVPLAPGADNREYAPAPTPRATEAPRVPEAPGVPTPATTPRPARAPRAGAIYTPEAAPTLAPGVPTPPNVPPTPAPLGWFGFSIRCNDCGWSRNGDEPTPRWESTTPPEISLIAPGSPADRAGFRAGDRITHIDGLSILRPEGARRFGAVRPGQRVRLTVLRDRTPISNDLVLGARPGLASRRKALRYTGSLKNVGVEVWSPQAATVQRDGDTLTISIGASTVRLKLNK